MKRIWKILARVLYFQLKGNVGNDLNGCVKIKFRDEKSNITPTLNYFFSLLYHSHCFIICSLDYVMLK